MRTLQSVAITRAYNIFKRKGTNQSAFEFAWRSIEINFPSLFTSTVIETALIKYNKTHHNECI